MLSQIGWQLEVLERNNFDGVVKFSGKQEKEEQRTLERNPRRTQKVPVSRQRHLDSFPFRLLTLLVFSFLLEIVSVSSTHRLHTTFNATSSVRIS